MGLGFRQLWDGAFGMKLCDLRNLVSVLALHGASVRTL